MPTQQELLLALGLKVTITIRGEPYSVCIRGWNENNYLITDIPKIQGETVRVAPQTSCVIRYVREGVVITFNSFVEFMYAQANSFMLLEFPKKYEKVKLRKNERLKVSVPLTYSQAVSGKVFEEKAVARDLSMEGALIFHTKAIENGSKMNINLTLPGGIVNNLEAGVRNVRHNPKNLKEPYVTGIKFMNLSDAHRDILKKYIASVVENK